MTLLNVDGKEIQAVPLRRCVVNFADNSGWYSRGQARLREILAGMNIDFRGYDDVPRGYAPHALVPYAMKAACIDDAFAAGYDTVIWMDASAVPQRDLTPIFEIAESGGAFISANYGISTGTWSTDKCLELMGITRAQAWDIPHCSALVCGFCRAHIVGEKLWSEYAAAARDGKAFVGPHKAADAPHLFTPDPSGRPIEGHRHDQTVLSILAWKFGVPLQPNKPDGNGGIGYLDYGEGADAIIAAYPTPPLKD